MRVVPLARCWLLGLLACSCCSAEIARAAEPLEMAVKAAYLAKFPFYVEWPSSAFATPSSPIVLCVVGEDPFGSMLDEAVTGQQVQGRAVTVRRLKNAARDTGCHMVYAGSDARAEALRASTNALVVTDSPAGAGAINFVIKDNRVRFTVDDDAAAQSGLAISSKLLSVALAVKSRGAR